MLNVYMFLSTYFAGINEKCKSDEGATAVEYGLMVAGIAMLIIAAVWLLGGSLSTLFSDVEASVSGT